ncbi:hypothetical protein [Allofournierella massiliensis]|uniref:hypothetical protein n=1 Tax=Allofournierella massiliensis TaxID=1650663 RepID=UPI00399F3380
MSIQGKRGKEGGFPAEKSMSIQGLSFTITSIALIIYLAIPDLINSITGMPFGLTLMILALLYLQKERLPHEHCEHPADVSDHAGILCTDGDSGVWLYGSAHSLCVHPDCSRDCGS